MRVCRHNGLSGTRRAEAGIYAALPLARKTWHVVNIQWSPARSFAAVQNADSGTFPRRQSERSFCITVAQIVLGGATNFAPQYIP